MAHELVALKTEPMVMTRSTARRLYTQLAGGQAFTFADVEAAALVAERFLEACAVGVGQTTETRWAMHLDGGRTGSLWIAGRLSALATIVWNDNYVLVCTIVRV